MSRGTPKENRPPEMDNPVNCYIKVPSFLLNQVSKKSSKHSNESHESACFPGPENWQQDNHHKHKENFGRSSTMGTPFWCTPPLRNPFRGPTLIIGASI